MLSERPSESELPISVTLWSALPASSHLRHLILCTAQPKLALDQTDQLELLLEPVVGVRLVVERLDLPVPAPSI